MMLPHADLISQQKKVCEKFNTSFLISAENEIVGISKDFDENNFPLNGLRHPKEDDTTGWYIWSGEKFSKEPDFFVPVHVKHLITRAPIVLPYLAMGPGWRFLVGENEHVDVWEDTLLLEVDK